MLDRLNVLAHSRLVNGIVAFLFALFSLIGYKIWGQTFLTEWAGGIAAAIGIACLVFKTQGYWAWSIVNAILWFFLFLDFHLPMLAGLQVMYIIFSLYGLTVWATTHFRIGYDVGKWKDNFGTVIGLGILGYAVYAYRNMPGYTFTNLWWLEFSGVFISIVSFWMDAFKYRTNWIGWTATNLLFGPLFYYTGLIGPLTLTFLFQGLCFVGMYRWWGDQKKAKLSGKVELVGGAEVL